MPPPSGGCGRSCAPCPGPAAQSPGLSRRLQSFYCEYARSWIDVKHGWGLTMQADEKDALTQMLGTC
ncbi:hypothetical protein ACFOY2_54710 [Nonomuraea purpurea]|uniref:Uncharacterized protein n=1 Tax=Nonomuraea purpurea TaxID=1849276 RepID=A0ABV8GQU8_9ACTN